MQKAISLLLLVFILHKPGLHGQSRYIDALFSHVDVHTDQVYGTNISVLLGAPTQQPLLMDVYEAAGDTVRNRPVVVLLHSGHFLPPYFNGQITGSRRDSSIVELCSQLAQRGYVAIAASYRQGWLPLSDPNTINATFLQALYRGVQDVRTLVRFLHRHVAEEGNTLGIDPHRIIVWGLGSGGMLSLGAAFLNNSHELLSPAFIDPQTLQPYVTETIHGDPYGLIPTALNTPNHPGYPSDIAMAVTMGGALPTTDWINGTPDEPCVMGYHLLLDPVIPFAQGVYAISSGTFPVALQGSYTAMAAVNAAGPNEVLAAANATSLPASFGGLAAALNVRNALLSQTPIQYSGQSIYASTPNLYTFITPSSESAPWDWWSVPQAYAAIDSINLNTGTFLDADAIQAYALMLHPDMSPSKALPYLDTVMAYFLPRACACLQLSECALTSSTRPKTGPLALQLSPNPSHGWLRVQSADPHNDLLSVQLYRSDGLLAAQFTNIRQAVFEFSTAAFAPGLYYVRALSTQGVLLSPVILTP